MKALFRDGAAPQSGRRLVVMHEPACAPCGVVIGVAAFGEEMNKGRRTSALAARALAQAGFLVLQPDLAGCGDSSGDLASVTWSTWVEDVLDTAHWGRSLAGAGVPITFWGTRAGCLVASQAQGRWQEPANLLLWQPQPNGKLVLQQFLRLKMAGQLAQGATKGITEGLSADLAAGRPVEIAGYSLGPRLAEGLAAAQLRLPAHATNLRVLWLEVSSQAAPELLPASQNIVQRWTAEGVQMRAAAVQGPQFWQTMDIEEAPALVQRTASEMSALREAMAVVA